ncbi:MAG: 2-polyprenyl-3-methyl-6-methoxy-1,4-benzoquinone monooxygenase [Pseudomonadota bacterium]
MPDTARHYNATDHCLNILDQAIQTVFGKPKTTQRDNPARGIPEGNLTATEREHHARLMRINHTGEVCAQGLYQGQTLTARSAATRAALQQAAAEENDHLDWCDQRIRQLGGRHSYLNPLWFAGSFALGVGAGMLGDRWSLGFVAETERQVEGHLGRHLDQITPEDQPTRRILTQMQTDETAHGAEARAQGGTELPRPLQLAMQTTSRLMTSTVYYC